MPLPERLAYNRVETDEEFRARIRATHKVDSFTAYELAVLCTELLDDYAWRRWKMQRKIVFVPA